MNNFNICTREMMFNHTHRDTCESCRGAYTIWRVEWDKRWANVEIKEPTDNIIELEGVH